MFGYILYLVVTLSSVAQTAAGTGEVCFHMLQPGASFCPDIRDLRFNAVSGYWEAEDGWRSAEKSFSERLDIFVGAQWRGTNVGRVACIYRSNKPGEFPIQISRDTLVLNPDGIRDLSGHYDPDIPLWEPDAQRSSSLNCKPKGGSVCDCPFFPLEQPKIPLEDEIRSIHKRSSEDAWMYI